MGTQAHQVLPFSLKLTFYGNWNQVPFLDATPLLQSLSDLTILGASVFSKQGDILLVRILIHFCVEVLRKSSFLFVSNNTMNHESVKFHAERCHVFRVKSRKSCWMKQSRFCLQNRVKYTVSKKRQTHLESRMWISVKFLSSVGFGFDGLTDPLLCRSIKGFDCRKRTRAGSLLIRNVHDFYFACASCDAQISAGSWLRRGCCFQGGRWDEMPTRFCLGCERHFPSCSIFVNDMNYWIVSMRKNCKHTEHQNYSLSFDSADSKTWLLCTSTMEGRNNSSCVRFYFLVANWKKKRKQRHQKVDVYDSVEM